MFFLGRPIVIKRNTPDVRYFTRSLFSAALFSPLSMYFFFFYNHIRRTQEVEKDVPVRNRDRTSEAKKKNKRISNRNKLKFSVHQLVEISDIPYLKFLSVHQNVDDVFFFLLSKNEVSIIDVACNRFRTRCSIMGSRVPKRHDYSNISKHATSR